MSELRETPSEETAPQLSGQKGGAVGIIVAIFVIIALAVAVFSSLAGDEHTPPPTIAPTATSLQPAAASLQPAIQPLSLLILHTNDTWGYLVPCG